MKEKLYTPMLRAKLGELQALKNLKPETREAILPLLHLMSPDQRRDGTQPATSDDYIKKVIKNIKSNWGILHAFFLDMKPARVTPEQEKLGFESASILKLQALPVVWLRNPAQTLSSYKEAYGHADMVCLRMDSEHVTDLNSTQQAEAFLNANEINPSDVVLMIDLGDVSAVPVTLWSMAADSFLKNWPLSASFKRIILTAGGFPHPNQMQGRGVHEFERKDWSIWSDIIRRNSALSIMYGDYAISYADLEPGISFTGAPNIRYTTEDSYVIHKGSKVSDPPLHMEGQYRSLSRDVYNQDYYRGVAYSWGDQYIYRCLDPLTQGTGNATTWRSVGTSQHIEHVVATLSSLSEREA